VIKKESGGHGEENKRSDRRKVKSLPRPDNEELRRTCDSHHFVPSLIMSDVVSHLRFTRNHN